MASFHAVYYRAPDGVEPVRAFLDDDVDEEDFEDPDAVPTTPPPPALQPNRQPARRAATNGDGPKETDPPKTGGEDPKTGGEDPKTGGEDPDAKANDPEK